MSTTRDRTAYLHAHYLETIALRGRRPRVPAQPVIEHVARCVELYGSCRQVAVRAGVSESTVKGIGRRATVRAATADALLSVPAIRPVTGLGLTRRVRALAVLGWTTNDVARLAGLNLDTVKAIRRGETTDPRPDTTERLVSAYEALSMRTPAERTANERRAAGRARAWASKRGWAPPMAWEGIDIDDPAATPDLGRRERGADLDDWLWLVRTGEHPERAARRLGVTLGAVEKAAIRHGRDDVLDRVYATGRRAVA